jgi:hypothetical protein
MQVVAEIGVEVIMDTISQPMPGSNPESEPGQMWLEAVVAKVQQHISLAGSGERGAKLFPRLHFSRTACLNQEIP